MGRIRFLPKFKPVSYESMESTYQDIMYDVSGGFGVVQTKVCPPFDSRLRRR